MGKLPSHQPGRRTHGPQQPKTLFGLLSLLLFLPCVDGIHHMNRAPLAWVNRRADNRPLVISNKCPDTIYPGIGTQAGTAPSTQGFRLAPGESRDLTVSADWQGRVWGRTNCSFNAAGTAPLSSGTGVACSTGDCGGTINCRGTVRWTDKVRCQVLTVSCVGRYTGDPGRVHFEFFQRTDVLRHIPCRWIQHPDGHHRSQLGCSTKPDECDVHRNCIFTCCGKLGSWHRLRDNFTVSHSSGEVGVLGRCSGLVSVGPATESAEETWRWGLSVP